MVDYIYKYWEPNQGFEELQAEVFNEGNSYKFQPANADQIKNQYEKENIDPKTVRYAFSGEKMVSYVQARIKEKSKEVHFSFPWAVPDTPTDVQDKLFDEMLTYIQKQENLSDSKIRVNAYAKPEENLEFLRKRGFVEKNAWKNLLLPLSDVSRAKYDEKFSSRIGTEEDIDSLITLIKEDGRYVSQFENDEAISKYLKESVLATGHLVLIYENDILAAASAPLIFKPPQEDEKRIILRFTAFKNVKNQETFIPMIVEVAKECLSSDYGKNKPLLVYTDNMDSPPQQITFLEQFDPIKSEEFMYYYYLEK
ncbi:MAG: hypothetical protein ACXAC8_05095 [Candidatus Hodarchaeales archaeon]|jgi:hypothetical protein